MPFTSATSLLNELLRQVIQTPPEVLEKQEQDRLQSLQELDILDTPAEEAFDALTRLASYICEAPISLITLLDSQRQWFKSKLGLEVPETAKEISFCQYAIRQQGIFEVPDAHRTEVFRENPLVTGDPHIRFYAGAPLITSEGHALGTLCIIDTVPRQLTERQRDALQTLAREVVSHLELRKARLLLAQEHAKMDGLLRLANSASDQFYLGGQSDLFVKHENRLIKLSPAEIVWVEALGDYVNIHTYSNRYTVHSTMKEMEAKLPARDFIRVHRKYIVRIDKIEGIEDEMLLVPKKGAANAKEVRNGMMYLPIGSSYRTSLMQRINLL